MCSMGRTRWTAPGRPVVAMRKSRRTSSGSFRPTLRKLDHLVMDSKRMWWSSSVMVPLPSPVMLMPLVKTITGMELALASATPGTE